MFDGPAKTERSVMHALAPIILASFLSTAGGTASGKARLTAAEVHRSVDAIGARATIQKLFDSSELENALVNGVATGGAGWLRVAERLAPAADGAAGLLLSLALEKALPKNPSGVLALIRRGTFDVGDACRGYGFGQYDETRPVHVLLPLVDKRLRAVRGVQDSHLADLQSACIDELGKLRVTLEGQRPK